MGSWHVSKFNKQLSSASVPAHLKEGPQHAFFYMSLLITDTY